MGTLQPKLGILTNLKDQYLRKTTNSNLSTIQPHNIKYYSNVIVHPGAELRSLRWEIGTSSYATGLIRLPSQY